jgi:predicted aminopeptidase
MKRLVVVALLVTDLGGCLYLRNIAQNTAGELDLLSRARPIEEVIKDPNTTLRTALLLAEIPAIKDYGRSYGLQIKNNYSKYTELPYGRPGVVWFVGGADPVQFKSVKYCFPIVGCFPGLGWFDEDEAIQHKEELEAQGYDATVRPASAFSTGGWFTDPVLSTMLGSGDDALPYLANTILHESVHATVLVPDEATFNESLASYVADALTDAWIKRRFGPGSPEELAHTLGQALGKPRTARTLETWLELKKLYDKKLPRAETLAKKAAIIDDLVADLHLRSRPNNATLGESHVYNSGAAPLLEAHRKCGDLRSMILAAKTLTRKDFTKDLQEDLTSIGAIIAQRCQNHLPETGSRRMLPPE